LRFADYRAELGRRHIQQRQNVAVLLAMDGIRGAHVSHVQARAIQNVRAVCNRQNLMLWLVPLQANKRSATSYWNVTHSSVIVVRFTKLSVVLLHADVGA